ncbi:TA system antitoxin ParD family protein [Thalassotalea eurytherma]|uniref:ParD-like antitoxin of type II toxin-antitoxin system n=1 Tax=Thalassotalea eurytherma TaxID=1144278 RepID=A0ABQ6H2Q9_9GAMM|nr:hypothetical protein [Thalassotalea eurytherma]GLX81862.1 hypothetical protein theurythT_13140 [Thalassotalea eurytherma]
MTTSSIKLDQSLIDDANIIAKALNRTASEQIEHWCKIGKTMEDNSDLTYDFVKQALIAKEEKNSDLLETYTFD